VYPAALMPAYPVDIRLDNLRNNDARLIAPLARLLFGATPDGGVVSDSSIRGIVN
jgi:hypothetical protein